MTVVNSLACPLQPRATGRIGALFTSTNGLVQDVLINWHAHWPHAHEKTLILAPIKHRACVECPTVSHPAKFDWPQVRMHVGAPPVSGAILYRVMFIHIHFLLAAPMENTHGKLESRMAVTSLYGGDG
jgi:hypothetical protein